MDEYFVNESAKYIFILVHMDGKSRNHALGLTDDLYYSKSKARAWYNHINDSLHLAPDTTDTHEAKTMLDWLYSNIIG